MTKPLPGGRPRLDKDDPSVQVNFKLPSKEFAELCKRASRAEISVAEMIRRDLREFSKSKP